MTCRSQGKKEEAVLLLRDSIQYGPEFADAYSSLASLLAEQVTCSLQVQVANNVSVLGLLVLPFIVLLL